MPIVGVSSPPPPIFPRLCCVCVGPASSTPCDPNPCLRGSCQLTRLAPGGYRCFCPFGYFGQNCSRVSQPNNPCDPNPCIRGACQADPSSPRGLRCLCPAGFIGQDCSTATGIPPNPSCPLYPCPADVPRHFYPDWDDLSCTRFYACEFGSVERRQCPQGQQFDLISMSCQVQTNPATAFCSSFRGQNPA
ncbi:hypothetical protein RRG08_047959 [Elysia crispata]|uniref:Uncharacterized protein n=1 Tax=Elysia crispata TaxID=231223 RepID=A0AAE1DNC3_9GAST|nr:hypothetical protein RRG08_047959 [Elysia crispata]